MRDQYALNYAIYGHDFDVDAVLAEARPHSEMKLWRKGDTAGRTKAAASSGIEIQILETNDPRRLAQATEEFLEKEVIFLHVAGRHTREKIWSVLGCRIFVYSAVQGKIWLPPRVLKSLGELGIELDVNAYPCSDPEEQ